MWLLATRKLLILEKIMFKSLEKTVGWRKSFNFLLTNNRLGLRIKFYLAGSDRNVWKSYWVMRYCFICLAWNKNILEISWNTILFAERENVAGPAKRSGNSFNHMCCRDGNVFTNSFAISLGNNSYDFATKSTWPRLVKNFKSYAVVKNDFYAAGQVLPLEILKLCRWFMLTAWVPTIFTLLKNC